MNLIEGVLDFGNSAASTSTASTASVKTPSASSCTRVLLPKLPVWMTGGRHNEPHRHRRSARRAGHPDRAGVRSLVSRASATAVGAVGGISLIRVRRSVRRQFLHCVVAVVELDFMQRQVLAAVKRFAVADGNMVALTV
jgi:hypothetical protein